MFKKIAIAILLKAIQSVDWEKLMLKILLRLAKEVREQTGLTIDVLKLDRGKLISAIEEVISDWFKINIDIDGDGKVGDGKEG